MAHVAWVALIHDLQGSSLIDTVQFTGLSFVYEVKQTRKCRAKTHASAATVAKIKDPFNFTHEAGFFIELRRGPVYGLAGRCFEIAFTRRHGVLTEKGLPI